MHLVSLRAFKMQQKLLLLLHKDCKKMSKPLKYQKSIDIAMCVIVLSFIAYLLLIGLQCESQTKQPHNFRMISVVKQYLSKSLKDPHSIEYISWSKPVFKNGSWIVRVRYRAKNSFGGYVVESRIFHVKDSLIILIP